MSEKNYDKTSELDLFDEEEVRLISYNDIKNEPTMYIKPKNLPLIEFNGITTFLMAGDIIVSNRKNYIGKIIPNFSGDYKIIAREFLTIIRPKKYLVLPEFLYMKFFEAETKEYLLSNMSGKNTKFISKKTFGNLSFNLPTLKAQEKLVNAYTDIERLLIGLQRKKKALKFAQDILSYAYTDEFKSKIEKTETALLKSDNLDAPMKRLTGKLKKSLSSLGLKT